MTQERLAARAAVGMLAWLLSFLMTVAAPMEVGLQVIRMETFLPADAESSELLEGLGAV